MQHSSVLRAAGLGIAFGVVATISAVCVYLQGAGPTSLSDTVRLAAFVTGESWLVVLLLGASFGTGSHFLGRLRSGPFRTLAVSFLAATLGMFEGFWFTFRTVHFPVPRGIVRFGLVWVVFGLVTTFGVALFRKVGAPSVQGP